MVARSRLIRNAFIGLGGTLLLLFLFLLLFGPYLAPYKPDEQNLFNTLSPPSSEHLFGTDHLGRDVLSRIIYGTRYSFLIALAAVSLASILGIPTGLIAGFFKGRTDDVIMRFVDLFLSIPELLSAIIIVTILGPGILGVILAISLSYAPRLARLTRGTVLQVSERDFIMAARAVGAGSPRIMFLHILPNATAPLLVEVTIRMGEAILITAALGFLGLGVRPPTPEWGAMISNGKDYLTIAPHIIMATGLAISLAVLCFNLLGDGLRDLLDPKLRQ
jgi:ABC-type dipeptide/oligopeptide/nickel transport system permease subunit